MREFIAWLSRVEPQIESFADVTRDHLLAYNEFLLSLVLTGPATKTLPVALAEYGAEDINYWTLSAAAAVGIMLPIVVFMMFLQRHLVRGLSMGAVKG